MLLIINMLVTGEEKNHTMILGTERNMILILNM